MPTLVISSATYRGIQAEPISTIATAFFGIFQGKISAFSKVKKRHLNITLLIHDIARLRFIVALDASMATEPKKQESLECVPTRSSMRALLLEVAVSDSDLRMLCIDHMPEMMRYFSAGMSYEAMVSTLLERVTTTSLLTAIENCQSMALRLASHRSLLILESPLSRARKEMQEMRASRLAMPPARSAYTPEWYVGRPEEEERALDALEYSGAAVVFNAPSGLGKTWLLQHIVDQIQPRGWVVNLDLRSFGSTEIMTSYSGFLRELARQILVDTLFTDPAQAMDIVDEAWRYSTNPIHNINTLMKRQILSNLTDGRWLILSLDGVDALSSHPYAEEFFTLLRSWMDSAGRPPWSALRLLLTLATAPRLLINCVHRSPFNVATQIYVTDFVDRQIDQLAAQYELNWQVSERQALVGLVGGHPYLLRLAMHEARRTGKSVAELMSLHSQIFTDHLYHQKRWLHTAPTLHVAFARALSNGRVPIDFDSFDRLRHAGLLVKDEGGELKPRYPIYGRLVSLDS